MYYSEKILPALFRCRISTWFRGLLLAGNKIASNFLFSHSQFAWFSFSAASCSGPKRDGKNSRSSHKLFIFQKHTLHSESTIFNPATFLRRSAHTMPNNSCLCDGLKRFTQVFAVVVPYATFKLALQTLQTLLESAWFFKTTSFPTTCGASAMRICLSHLEVRAFFSCENSTRFLLDIIASDIIWQPGVGGGMKLTMGLLQALPFPSFLSRSARARAQFPALLSLSSTCHAGYSFCWIYE